MNKTKQQAIIPLPVLTLLQSHIANNKQHQVFKLDPPKENTKTHDANVLQAHSK